MTDNSWDRQTFPPAGTPHVWLQWKCTDVGGDFYCKCGYHGWVEGDYAYYVECANCHQIYRLNGHVELVPLIEGEFPPNTACLKQTDLD